MNRLQDALDKWDLLMDNLGLTQAELTQDEWRILAVVEQAARRIPHGIHIRYCIQHEGRMPYGANQCQVADDRPCDAGDYLLVTALAVTEEDEEEDEFGFGEPFYQDKE